MNKTSIIILILSVLFYVGSLMTNAWLAPTLAAIYLALVALYLKK